MSSPRKISVAVAVVCAAMSSSAHAGEGADRKALFGDLHMHTSWSFDAYLFSTRATPDDAYEFAKGKPLEHPLGKTYKLSRPSISWP